MINLVNSKVYEDGVRISLNKKLALLLMTDDEMTVGTSACIYNDGGQQDNYLDKKLSWDPDEKIITIGSFEYGETRSVLELEKSEISSYTATTFAIVELDDESIIKETKPAYNDGTLPEYYWPYFSLNTKPFDDQILFKGSLETPIEVQANNNFKIKETEIKFSEIQNI